MFTENELIEMELISENAAEVAVADEAMSSGCGWG